MKSWFSADLSAISQLPVNQLSAKELASHPYVSYKQARVIERQVPEERQVTGLGEPSLTGGVHGIRPGAVTALLLIPIDKNQVIHRILMPIKNRLSVSL